MREHTARFLGHEVVALHDDTKRCHHGRRSIKGAIGIKIPVDVIKARGLPYLQHGKPIHRPERRHNSDDSIAAQYRSEYRGIVQYCQLAYNLRRFARQKWVLERSLTNDTDPQAQDQRPQGRQEVPCHHQATRGHIQGL